MRNVPPTPANYAQRRSEETPDGRWRPYSHDAIISRDKVSLDLSWLRDESLEDSASLPDPHILAQEIADDLRSALGQIGARHRRHSGSMSSFW